jgi:hypothetical protein
MPVWAIAVSLQGDPVVWSAESEVLDPAPGDFRKSTENG